MKQIDKLKELTKNLPELYNLVEGKIGSVIESDSTGLVIHFFLMKDINEKVSVQRIFISESSKLAFPVHHAKEWVLVYNGNISLEMNGETKTYSAGEVMEIAPETLHSITALDDAWAICIAVPAMESYPDENK